MKIYSVIMDSDMQSGVVHCTNNKDNAFKVALNTSRLATDKTVSVRVETRDSGKLIDTVWMDRDS